MVRKPIKKRERNSFKRKEDKRKKWKEMKVKRKWLKKER